LHGDSYSLLELLDRVIWRVSGHVGTTTFDVEAIAGNRRIYIDVIWTGQGVAASQLNGWLDEQLEDVLGGLSSRDILERHKTDIWSLPDRPGQARLRLPMPPSSRQVAPPEPEGQTQQARPEFYDFELLQRPLIAGELGPRPLKSLTYVVFDTETTGLDPLNGDEIVSIAGVRIVNGRILTGESFERLVNPRRPIPPESIRFHGITDEMVRDKPPVQVVLPQFRAFVGDAVLIAHNAAFDMTFLKLREAECGVTFEMAVLDTLFLSCVLHDYTPKHNLDVVAQRFGIPIQGRHTALGDALVTAGCFLKMLDVLEAQGVRTLDQALAASHRVMQAKAREARF
jgi:DNA polymerase-3 subunit epsilon